jgi:flavin reductase (DIM6/NTAB) family NADH-FMN oxidoreductase RutF
LSFNFAELQPTQRYKLLCGLVVPRPIALVTSTSPDGVVNAAPFSFFNVFSEHPALLVLGLQHNEDGSPKDTTRNIHLTGEFVVNLVDEGIAEAMNLTATDFPPGGGEPSGARPRDAGLDAGQAAAAACSARRLRMPAHGGPCLWPAA